MSNKYAIGTVQTLQYLSRLMVVLSSVTPLDIMHTSYSKCTATGVEV
jgi:hypothetical protein